MIGKTLSHYKVIEKIGQGGMGEVYRAEDTNLSRDVAIKVLPERFTKDPQRLAPGRAQPNRPCPPSLRRHTTRRRESTSPSRIPHSYEHHLRGRAKTTIMLLPSGASSSGA